MGETGTTTGGLFVFINDTTPDIDADSDFKIGGRGSFGFGPSHWTYVTMQRLYCFLHEEEFDASDKSIPNTTLKLQSNVNPVCLQCWRLMHNDNATENYYYKFLGYRDKLAYDERTLYVYIVLRPHDYNSKYANITEMCQWVVDNIIDKVSEQQSAAMVGSGHYVTVQIRCSVGVDDFVPTLDWNSKKYDNTYSRAVTGRGRYIDWKVSFHDSAFDRFGRPKRGGSRLLSKQQELVMDGHWEYYNDLKNGLYGRWAQKHYEEESKIV